jgi:hypothetical protein
VKRLLARRRKFAPLPKGVTRVSQTKWRTGTSANLPRCFGLLAALLERPQPIGFLLVGIIAYRVRYQPAARRGWDRQGALPFRCAVTLSAATCSGLPVPCDPAILSRMGTKSRDTIYGG